MMAVVMFFHVIVCVGLIVIVLIQRGRGGGLVESFAGMESMFGTKTSVFLTKATTIMSVIFFVTCLLLAVMSVRKSSSLMKGARIPAEQKHALGHPIGQGAEQKHALGHPTGQGAEQKSAPSGISPDAKPSAAEIKHAEANSPSSDAAAPKAHTQGASQSTAPAAPETQPQEETASTSK